MVAREQEINEPQDRMWYCWKQRPLKEFPFFQRLCIRLMYCLFGWSFNDGSREGLCIAYSEEEAKEIISHYKGGRAKPFPLARTVEEALPEAIVHYGRELESDREAQAFYVRRNFKQVNINADLLNETRELARGLRRKQ